MRCDAMASDSIPAQLASLLGHPVQRIRITDETPPRVSVVDVISAITRKSANEAAEQLRRLIERYPDVEANCFVVKFPKGKSEKRDPGPRTQDPAPPKNHPRSAPEAPRSPEMGVKS